MPRASSRVTVLPLPHHAPGTLDYLGTGPTTRASLAIYNTHDEVEQLLGGVAHAIGVLR